MSTFRDVPRTLGDCLWPIVREQTSRGLDLPSTPVLRPGIAALPDEFGALPESYPEPPNGLLDAAADSIASVVSRRKGQRTNPGGEDGAIGPKAALQLPSDGEAEQQPAATCEGQPGR
ncbi:hypothetical protein AB0L13_35335 [Saccharopolyspora shandongensis]|uniref:hypothetical protein n=1 Tax=Saccharopolyspora shandongensis TaxID=418495 RepID=UPI00342A5C22